MKNYILPALLLLVTSVKTQTSPTGAWHKKEGGTEKIICILPSYFSYAEFDKAGKKFISAWGGVCKPAGDSLYITVEYNTAQKEAASKKSLYYSINNNQLITNTAGTSGTWQKLDDGNTALAGVWRITAREQNGRMSPMPKSARKTIKIMTGTRFQWVAINTSTGDFFGTGGGTYTFENGTYTEHIEFFPRDNSRVGASLQFKGRVTGNEWNHSGLSSKGDPIHEIWTKETH